MALGKNIGNLVISLTGDTKQFNQSMQQAQTRMGGLKQSFKSAMPAILGITAAVGGATVAIKKIMQTTIQYGVQVDKMTKQADISAKSFTRLAYAAEQEHASMDTLAKSLQLLPKYMQYAKDGMATYKREFDRMGISVTDANGNLKSGLDILMEMADYMSNKSIPNTEKTATAMTLLGRRGAEMVPFLSLGREEIEKLGDEAERLGLVIDDITAKKMKAFDDEITKAKMGIKGFSVTIGTELMPYIKDWIEGMGILTQKITNLLNNIKWEKTETDKLANTITWLMARRNELIQQYGRQDERVIRLTEKIKKLRGEQQELGESMRDETEAIDSQTEAMEDKVRETERLARDIANLDAIEEYDIKTIARAQNQWMSYGGTIKSVAETTKWTASEILNLTYSLEGLVGMFKKGEFSISGFLKGLSGILMMMPGMQGAGIGAGILGSVGGMIGLKEGGIVKGGLEFPFVKAQEGVIVNKPTMAMIGEGGKSEIVSPVDKLLDMAIEMRPHITISGDIAGFVKVMEESPAGLKDRFYRGVTRNAINRDKAR